MFRNRLAFLAGFGIVAAVGAPIAQHHIDNQPAATAAADVMEGRPSVTIPGEARMSAMIEAGTCWIDGTDRPIPGRVWVRVSRNGGAAYDLRGQRAVGDSLEQIFDGIEHGLDPIAFCR